MKNAIILHGRPTKKDYYNPDWPSESNAHRLPWLQKQLIVHDIAAATPDVPFSFAPKWETWVKEVKRYEIGPETTLVGHSCGGGFWVRYLSEHKDLKVGKVLLVAPWVNAEHEDDIDFFDFEIDPEIVNRAEKFTIFASDNDFSGVQNSVKYLREKLPGAKYREFKGYGHFIQEQMDIRKFPELLKELV